MHGKLFYETGEVKYEGEYRKGNVDYEPCGAGTRYFENGQIHLEGIFNDWFIEIGREYYPSGQLKFEGEFNKGPRTYYGPRYYIKGSLFRENGLKWFTGLFRVERRGSMGYPHIKFPECFFDGIEYTETGVEIYHKPSDYRPY